MDGDDDLQLNLAGFEAPLATSNPRSKGNRHTIAFKKQQKVTSVVSELTTASTSRGVLVLVCVRRSKSKQNIVPSALTSKVESVASLHPQLQPVL